MMISILIIIIIITQWNSPQNRYFIFPSNKPSATIKLGRIKEKEIILMATIHFPPASHPLFPSPTLFLHLTPSQK